VGGVIVLRDAPRVRDVLVPVYDALDFEWDPGATGSIEEEIGRERATHEALVDALLEEFGTACEEAVFDPESLALATDLEPQQRP
jgi:hypothetical protein